MDKRPKLLVLELWGLGDVAMATPFIRAASAQWEVTLLAKPHATQLQFLWPEVRVMEFTAPWTAFRGKYQLWKWPWGELWRISRQMREGGFDCAVSARWDPRDHLLMQTSGAAKLVGFPRLGSGIFLTESLVKPGATAHRHEYWRSVAARLGVRMEALSYSRNGAKRAGPVIVHTGAAQPVRIWPLERFHAVVNRLRASGKDVRVLCDLSQREWWIRQGETNVQVPQGIANLKQTLENACAFIGNDSGPGHLAAMLNVPTFTIFGPASPEMFAPIHPNAEWIAGADCPYKPCYDSCRFPQPNCILATSEQGAWEKVQSFVERNCA